MCAGLDVADLAGHQIGTDEAAATAHLGAVFASEPAAVWLDNPGLAGGVGPVNAPEDLLCDPQFVARDSITTIHGTDTRILASPIRLRGIDGHSSTATAPPPEIGEHTQAVLAEAGFTPREIADLCDARIV